MRHDECSEARLMLYLDGEASLAERAATQAHLEACWLCRGRLAHLERDLHRIADAVAGASGEPFPAQRMDAARNRLRTALALERQSATSATPLARLWRVAWIPAAAAAFTGGMAWVANLPSETPPAAPSPTIRRVVVEPATAPVFVPPPTVPPPAPATPARPARSELVRFALQVYETAHAMGLTVERPLQIRIEGRAVQVTGLSAEEEENLRLALALEDRQTDWFEGAAPLEPTGETNASPLVEGPATSLDLRIPLHAEIAAIAGGDDSVKAFADRAVRLSEQINRRAHALDELALALPEADEALLGEAERMRLSLLVVEHLREMERHAGELRLQLALLTAPAEPRQEPAAGGWQEIAAQYRARYAPVHRAVLDLFTLQPGREVDVAGGLAALAELWGLDAGRAWHPRLTRRN